MSDDYEISRLKSPLRFDDYKSYDSKGDFGNCVDLITRVDFYLEPNGNLSNSEILKYAPKSKAASKIRLENGFGGLKDILNLNPSVPWILGLYYVILIYLFIPSLYFADKLFMYIFLIFLVFPLFYLGYKFNVNKFSKNSISEINSKPSVKVPTRSTDNEDTLEDDDSGNTIQELNETLKYYKKQFEILTRNYEDKEKIVKKVIKKRFQPPQITYDKFISSVDNCHDLFYKELDIAYTIIELNKDTLKVRNELDNKLKLLNLITKQIDDLSDELIINLGAEESNEMIEDLLKDMENLIKSIKDYN